VKNARRLLLATCRLAAFQLTVVYDSLLTLLLAFPTPESFDWRKTVESQPMDKMVIPALFVDMEMMITPMMWLLDGIKD
jgi:hypothetical protein